MEGHHQEILQTVLEMDSIRANPRYKALILMSRQTNEKREYEGYCNRIRMLQNKVDKIKGSFLSNHGRTYEQFLLEKQSPIPISPIQNAEIVTPQAQIIDEPVIDNLDVVQENVNLDNLDNLDFE